MKNLMLTLLIIFSVVSFAVAGHKRVVQVDVVAPSEDRAFKFQRPGLAGVIAEDLFTGLQHARLKCLENYRGCTALGPGSYKGELQGSDVWITIKVPLQDKATRDHWRVAGSLVKASNLPCFEKYCCTKCATS